MIFAAAMPVAVGVGCLSAQAELWYMIKRQTQSTADAAAIAAAYEVITGRADIPGDLTQVVSEAAEQNGYREPHAVDYVPLQRRYR